MRNTKNWAIAGLVIAVAILLYLLLSDTKQPDSHQVGNVIAQADYKIVTEQRNAGLKIIDSLKRVIKKRDTTEAKLKAELAIYRRDLDKSTAKAVQLAKDIKELQQQQQDTSALGRKADGLANEAMTYAYLYSQYKAHSDSLSVLVDSNKVTYEAAINEQKRLYDELYRKYEQLYRLYNILFKDHQQSGKKLRREKLKTKIAAVLGLLGLGAASLK